MSNEHDRDRDPADEAGRSVDPTDPAADDAARAAGPVDDEPTTTDEHDGVDDQSADDRADGADDGVGDDGRDGDDGDDEDDDDDRDDDDRELVGAGVASAGSARAAARRSSVRSGVTEKKGRATLPRDGDRDERPNVFARIGRFLREVVAELRKVIWPHRSQLVTYTTVVLVFVVFMTALVFGLDWLFARGVLWVFGGGS